MSRWIPRIAAQPGAGGVPVPPGNGTVYQNTARVDLYVSDINGNNVNDGLTPATAVQTLAGALSKITFQLVAFDVVIHVGAHGGAGYTWATIDGYTLIDGASIYVYGDGAGQPGEDGFTVVVGPTNALAGSTDAVVKSAALGVDAYFAYTIEILTGAAAGDRRTIKKNTATDILPTMRFSVAVALNDQYRIVQPSVVVVLPAAYANANPGSTTILCTDIGSPIYKTVDSSGGPENVQRSALTIVNVDFTTAAGAASDWSAPECVNSLVRLFGVVFKGGFLTSSGEMAFGVTDYTELANTVVRASLPALLASTTAWRGWGIAHVNTNTTRSLYLVGSGHRYGCVVGRSLRQSGGTFDFYAGRLLTTSPVGGLLVSGGRAPAMCQLGTYGFAATPFLGLTIETTTGQCIRVSTIGSAVWAVNLGSTAPLTLIATTGTCVYVDNQSMCSITAAHNFAGGFSANTAGWGVSVKRGGRLICDHDMSGNITSGLGDFTLNEINAIPGASLNGPGKFMASADGSSIISAD